MLSHTGCRTWRAPKLLRNSWGIPFRTYKLGNLSIAQSPLSAYPWAPRSCFATSRIANELKTLLSWKGYMSPGRVSCATGTLGGPGFVQ
jgi:hypothetical protein